MNNDTGIFEFHSGNLKDFRGCSILISKALLKLYYLRIDCQNRSDHLERFFLKYTLIIAPFLGVFCRICNPKEVVLESVCSLTST